MPSHTQLRHVPDVGTSLLSDNLEANVVGFFQWGLLGAGGFFNVVRPTEGPYGGDAHQLRLVDDPNYDAGQVWEAFRKDWVWESGVEYTTQPIQVSGIWVDNTFHSSSETGAYSHYIDYPNGRVVFNTAIAPTGTVEVEYSPRLYQFYSADAPWWQQVQPNSFRVDDTHFLQQGSGAWDVLAQNRVQLPAVVVEAVPNTSRRGRQIGGGEEVKQDVLFHILTEDRWHFKWIHDAITYQWGKRLQGFDKNRMFTDNRFPLDANGSPNPSGLMYPDLVKPSGDGGYYWEQIRIEDMRSQDQRRLGNLHYCTIRAKLGVDIGP